MNTFTVQEPDRRKNDTLYVIDNNGVIKQLYPSPFKYDAGYVSIYDTPEYAHKSQALQRLRLGYCEAMFGKEIESLIDVGYGNGAFLEYVKATKTIDMLCGHDISNVEAPKGVIQFDNDPYTGWRTNRYNVITFWDCLEHYPDISFVADLTADMIIVSLPWCHFNLLCDQDIEWFQNWHHRKPNEHLHHFNQYSLAKTMKMYGWRMVHNCNMEDIVRIPKILYKENILTAAFKRY